MEPCSENALVYMAKWPEPGRSKTRLSPPLTPTQAAELARCFLLDMLAGAAVIDADRWLAFTPASAGEAFRQLVGTGVGLVPAEAADLGAGLYEGQRAALARGYRRVALVASDLPHLPVEHYVEGFAALHRADVALGPSADGGYYLLATARETPLLFQNVTWSTAAVRQQTLRQAAASRLSVAVISACDDVDTAEGLPRLLISLRGRPGAGRTLALLERLTVLQSCVSEE